MTNEESICHHAFSAMVDDVEALCLVWECGELKERYKSNFTSQILNVKMGWRSSEKHKTKPCCWIKFQRFAVHLQGTGANSDERDQ